MQAQKAQAGGCLGVGAHFRVTGMLGAHTVFRSPVCSVMGGGSGSCTYDM